MEKIGIVTSARELNYGALLQAYALQCVLCAKGFDARLLWWANQKVSRRDVRLRKLFVIAWKFICNPSIIRKSIGAYGHTYTKDFTEKSKQLFQIYEDEYLKIKFLSYGQMKQFAQASDCRALIAGSDQIWNSYAVYVDPFYYLRFAPKNKRIAYAPSLGKNDIPAYNKNKIKKYVKDFKYLSVREKSGKKILEELTTLNVPVVLDPSFLLNNKQWESVERQVEVPEKYILLYFLDEPNSECLEILKTIIKKLNYQVLALPYKFSSFDGIDGLRYVDAGPSEFLYLVHKSQMVLTDSFHGSALSINYNKQFFVFDRQYGKNQSQVSRIIDLLDTFGLQSRFVKSPLDSILERPIDYTCINERLHKLRCESFDYLDKSLK